MFSLSARCPIVARLTPSDSGHLKVGLSRSRPSEPVSQRQPWLLCGSQPAQPQAPRNCCLATYLLLFLKPGMARLHYSYRPVLGVSAPCEKFFNKWGKGPQCTLDSSNPTHFTALHRSTHSRGSSALAHTQTHILTHTYTHSHLYVNLHTCT